VEAVPDPLLVVGLDGHLHAASPAAVRQLASLGLAPADLAVDVRAFRDFLRRCARTSSPLPGAVPFRRGDADARQFRCHGTRLVLPARGEAAILLRIAADALTDGGSVFRQLTHQVAKLHRELRERQELARRQREAEARLFEAQKLDSLGLLAGGIAHDFNNLLMGVLGHIDLAGRDVPVDGPAADSLRQAARSATRAADLTRQLLAYAGRGRFVVESIDLSALVADMVPLLEVAHAKKAVLRTMLDPALPSLQGDATQLRQVLLNLLGNAIKFTDAGEVRLTARVIGSIDDPRVAFEIRDTGIGMAPHVLARLFQPFTQGDASSSRRFGGTGLGLAICERLVDLMGGRITVDSTPGEGSTFRVVLPLPLAKAPPAPAEPPHESSTRTAHGRALLAEDNPVNRKVALLMLARLGWEVDAACDGREALELLERDTYDVLLLDVQMPEVDGLEVARRVVASWPDPETRPWMIAVTANAIVGDREACLDAGMDDFVAKPFGAAQVREALRRWVSTPEQAGAIHQRGPALHGAEC